MKKLLLSMLLVSSLLYTSINATELGNYFQNAKQNALERLHHEDITFKVERANYAKLYDKNGNLILEMNLNLKDNEKISFSKKSEQQPWENVVWYVYDENGEKYEMTDTEKKEVFMRISGSIFNWIGKI